MSAPDYALVCGAPDCTFRPDLDETVQAFADHFDAEHGGGQPTLELVILCPLDGQSLIFGGPKGQVVGNYSCPTCMRTYTLKRNPLESA